MAVYAISFRLEVDDDYDDRWDRLVGAIKAEAEDKNPWDAPTSFFILESHKETADLGDSIKVKAELDDEKDLLLVINLSSKEHVRLGLPTDEADLDRFLNAR